jgi:hypothetical protein
LLGLKLTFFLFCLAFCLPFIVGAIFQFPSIFSHEFPQI